MTEPHGRVTKLTIDGLHVPSTERSTPRLESAAMALMDENERLTARVSELEQEIERLESRLRDARFIGEARHNRAERAEAERDELSAHAQRAAAEYQRCNEAASNLRARIDEALRIAAAPGSYRKVERIAAALMEGS